MQLRLFRQHRPKPEPKDAGEPPFIETLILWALFFVASQLLAPKPEFENAKPAGLGDFSFPTATEQRAVPMLWGTVRIDGPNTVWYGDLQQAAITEKVKTGIFGGGKSVITGFRYFIGIQFAICRDIGLTGGSILQGMWIGDDRVFTGSVSHDGTFTVDDPELFGGDDNGAGGFNGTFRFHDGNGTQAVSSYLSAFQQQGGDTPAYRGTVYVAPDTAAPYVGNQTSINAVKWEVKRIPNGLGLGASQRELNSGDANPMNVLYELFTDKLDGLGYDPSSIDTANWTTAATTLANENNGFSFLLDREQEVSDVIRQVEEQIDGVVYFDQSVQQWRVLLARDDYVLSSLTALNETNVREVQSFDRGSWENTTNVVRVAFTDRDDDYKGTYATAMDMANIRLQNGVVIASDISVPGCFDGALANDIAWKKLRTLSYPLAKATLLVDRAVNEAIVGRVYRFSNAELGVTDLPMRVTRVNPGSVTDGTIRLDLVQDVFTSQAGSYVAPPDSGWEPPTDTLAAFNSDRQFAFEAPRRMIELDPETPNAPNRIAAMARRQGPEVQYLLRERNAAGVPSGDFTDVSTGGYEFTFLGTLTADLDAGSPYPLSSFVIAPSDTQAQILAAIEDTVDPLALGPVLLNLVVIDPGGTNEEYMLVQSAVANATNVQLNNVYRGVLDTVQRNHASGAEVWVAQVQLSGTTVPETNQVDVKLLPKSLSDEVAEGDATTINFTMDKRYRRPYPPALVTLDGTDWSLTEGLEDNGAGAEDFHIDLAIRRRDYRTANEVEGLLSDAETLDTTFPAANTTTHIVDVRDDPDGTNTLLYSQTFSGADTDILRLDILREANGSLPTRLRFVLRSSHDDTSETLTSRNDLVWDFDVTSGLTGQFEFGALQDLVTSALYTATVAGDYDFTLSSAFASSDVEYRLNGGTWTTLISSGGTSGTIVGVVVSDTIEVRWTSGDTNFTKQLDMAAAGAGQDAFAILYEPV